MICATPMSWRLSPFSRCYLRSPAADSAGCFHIPPEITLKICTHGHGSQQSLRTDSRSSSTIMLTSDTARYSTTSQTAPAGRGPSAFRRRTSKTRSGRRNTTGCNAFTLMKTTPRACCKTASQMNRKQSGNAERNDTSAETRRKRSLWISSRKYKDRKRKRQCRAERARRKQRRTFVHGVARGS